MNLIEPSSLADVWYLRYQHSWVRLDSLPQELRCMADSLKKSGKLDYHMMVEKEGYYEVLKLRGESCRS